MSVLITLLVVVLILGVIIWLVRMLPLAEPFRIAAIVIVALIAILYLATLLPHGGSLAHLTPGKP